MNYSDTIKKIIAPTDLTDASIPAVGYAISLAKKHGSEVAALHVFPVKEMQEPFSDRCVVDGLVASTEAPRGGPLDLDHILEGKMRLVRDFLEKKIAPEIMKG